MSNEFDYDSNPGTSQQNQQRKTIHPVIITVSATPMAGLRKMFRAAVIRMAMPLRIPTPQQGRAPRARPVRPAAPKAIRHRSSRAAIMRTRAAAVPSPR